MYFACREVAAREHVADAFWELLLTPHFSEVVSRRGNMQTV